MLQYYGYVRHRQRAQQSLNFGKFDSAGFTLISLTLGTEPNYLRNIRSWLATDPHRLIVSTTHDRVTQLKALLKEFADEQVFIVSVPRASWRQQCCQALPHVKTPYTVFLDDRVRWRPQLLQLVAKEFSNPSVGGVTTVSTVVPKNSTFTIWESFGALNIVRRNILNSFLAYFGDGNSLNLSGRTSAYRTRIIQQSEFYHGLQNEYWRGKHLITTGDDNFLTTWILSHGWATGFVSHENARVFANVNGDSSYLKQVTRWSRDTARCYSRDLWQAVRTRNIDFLQRTIMKIVANYSSDLAIIVEVCVLLLLTLIRNPIDGEVGFAW